MIIMNIKFVILNKSNSIELALLMSWRSNPDIYKFFLLQKCPLNWTNRHKFITDGINRLDYLVFIQDRPVGHVALSKIDHDYPEVSIMLGDPTLWGKGYSTIILDSFLQLLRESGYHKFSAIISNLNLSSIKMFQNMGFIKSEVLKGNSEWNIYLLDTILERS